MANNLPGSRADTRTVTLIGQAASGKTHMIAALLINKPVHDLTLGEPGLVNPRISPVGATDSEEEERKWHLLNRHFNSMFLGRESDIEATQDVTDYSFSISWDGVNGPKKASRIAWLLPRQRLSPRRPEPGAQVPIRLIDGRGGDLAYDEFLESAQDPRIAERRTAYRDALRQAGGVVICHGLTAGDYQQQNMASLQLNIDATLESNGRDKKLPLKYIAICLTKYEALFPAHGANAAAAATDREAFIRRIKRLGLDRLFGNVLTSGGGVQVRVFPVSTYGFVDGHGSANYYPWKGAPGLLTRAIDEADYDDPDLPGLRDHYPVPISQAMAMARWQPFNLAPPLLFAATGRITGPLSVGAEELV